jgi:hypothetical protein
MCVASTISLTTFNTNQSVYGQTLKKTSMVARRALTIQSSDIKAEIDNPATLPQVYTFGPSIQNQWVVVGSGQHTIYYSNNGNNWVSSLDNPFGYIGTGLAIAWNGSRWVVGGDGTTTLAYSDDNGIHWTNVLSPSLTIVYSIIWTGTQWIATGTGGGQWIINSINGTTWNTITTNISLLFGYGIAWNGSIGVAVGEGDNSILYSDPYSYTTWHPATNTFSTRGYAVAWNGRMWVAVGEGGSTILYSINAQTWTNASGTLFSTAGYYVAWNGNVWVAVGKGSTSIVYSLDGITWNSGIIINPAIVTIDYINAVTWNGTLWIATIQTVGGGGHTANSFDGISWTVNVTTIFDANIQKVAFNNRRPYTLTFPTNVSTATISTISPASFPLTISANNQLDIVSDAYYNTGYTNFSMVVRGQYS